MKSINRLCGFLVVSGLLLSLAGCDTRLNVQIGEAAETKSYEGGRFERIEEFQAFDDGGTGYKLKDKARHNFCYLWLADKDGNATMTSTPCNV